MNRFAALILITFIESVSLAMAGIGVYFYAHEILDFSAGQNLALALANGAAYVATALLSQRVSRRLGEKPVFALALGGQALCHVLMWSFATSPWCITIGSVVFSMFNGLKWPVLESYISAGRTPGQTARALGRFNLAWSLATPLGVFAAGPVIGSSYPALLFAAVLAMDLASLALIWPLERVPQHLPDDHPLRPDTRQLTRWQALLTSSRWSLTTCYALLFMLNALLPDLFADMGFDVTVATALAAVIHVARFAVFVVMRYTGRWHGWVGVNILTIAATPLGFALIVAEQSLAIVLAGEFILGVATGMAYYAALYYAMVIKNAAVDAGGGHEAAIGSGLAGGPAIGLVGTAVTKATGSQILGMLWGVGPFLLAASLAGAWPLRRAVGTADNRALPDDRT